MKRYSLSDYIQFSDQKFSRNIIKNGEKSQAFLLNFKPGQSLPPHPHPHADVYVTVWEGQGTFSLDEETSAVTRGSFLHCRGSQIFSFINDSEADTTLYVVLAND